MTEEKPIQKAEEQKNKRVQKEKVKDVNTMTKKELSKSQIKTEEKPIQKAEEKSRNKQEAVKTKKYSAIAKSLSIHASKKHCMYICSFIKNKKIDYAIADLESVIKMKTPIPFKGEIPHRKGKIMSGRYPVSASKLFIPLLKSLKGNAIVNGLDLEKTRIVTASASWASRPMRRGQVEGKRTNVILTAKEISSNKEKKK